jgi:predicted NUDIX family NTP pyrophosphohydrolase
VTAKAVTSAGLLLYRATAAGTQVLLLHPGGPYWMKKDAAAWSVPKGLVEPGEDELHCARREFTEETGFDPGATGGERDLGVFRLPSGKRLHVWAMEGDCDPSTLKSNLFEMEWPPGSGRRTRFPEADRGAWFDQQQALLKISTGQRAVLEKFYAEIAARRGRD